MRPPHAWPPRRIDASGPACYRRAVIKICSVCRSTWAGGRVCEDCGGALEDPFGEAAETFPEGVWKYIRLQYGARRGMLVRVVAYLLGPVVGFLLLRQAAGNVAGSAAAIAIGLATWWTIHWAAGRAVRIWVLRKGQVSKRRLAKAMLKRAVPRRS